MTTFKKQFIEGSRYNLFFDSLTGDVSELEAPVNTAKISVTTDSDSIFVLVTREEDSTALFNFEIPYNIITENTAFGDQTLWAITDSCIKNKRVDGESEPYVLTQQDIINVGATTFVSKDSRIFREEYNNYYSPIRIFVPSKTSTIDDLTIVFIDDLPRDTPVITVFETNPSTTDVLESWKDLLATITVTGPTSIGPDETADLNVTCSDTSVTEIFVEPVIGATNKTRVIMNNGQGTLKVNTFGLSSGDEIDIKFGYKYFTGISRYTKTVS